MRIGFVMPLIVLAITAPSPVTARDDPPRMVLVGSEFSHLVHTGDSLASLGARFGVDAATLARENNLKINARLKEAQIVRIDNRHIVPDTGRNGIVINVPQRMLFLFDSTRLVASYPVGLGRPGWPTPVGPFTVLLKEIDPVWDVPPSIQEEMRRQGKLVVTRVLPGPQNPLGRHWIGTSQRNLGIHGTVEPASVYRFQSHGCIRLHPDDVADLFPRVGVGTPGEIVYLPVLMARASGGAVYLEVHKDIYRRAGDLWTRVEESVEKLGAQSDVNWALARVVVRAQEGVARDVSVRLDQPPGR